MLVLVLVLEHCRHAKNFEHEYEYEYEKSSVRRRGKLHHLHPQPLEQGVAGATELVIPVQRSPDDRADRVDRREGAQALVEGFEDFCRNARVIDYAESEHAIDDFGSTAVGSFRFSMVYEREGKRFRATGRDLWLLERLEGRWRAVWRTMQDMAEEEVTGGAG